MEVEHGVLEDMWRLSPSMGYFPIPWWLGGRVSFHQSVTFSAISWGGSCQELLRHLWLLCQRRDVLDGGFLSHGQAFFVRDNGGISMQLVVRQFGKHPLVFDRNTIPAVLSCIFGRNLVRDFNHYISSLYWFTMRYPGVFFRRGCYFSLFLANTNCIRYKTASSLLFSQYPNGPNVEPLPRCPQHGDCFIPQLPWLGFLPKTWVTNHLIFGICSSQLLMTGILLMGKYNPPHYWELMSLLP